MGMTRIIRYVYDNNSLERIGSELSDMGMVIHNNHKVIDQNKHTRGSMSLYCSHELLARWFQYFFFIMSQLQQKTGGIANLDLRVMVDSIYVGDHKILLLAEYISLW